MAKVVRSARGEGVDFSLLEIKAQIAAAPVPKKVIDRQKAIIERDTGKPVDDGFFAAAIEAAQASEAATQLPNK